MMDALVYAALATVCSTYVVVTDDDAALPFIVYNGDGGMQVKSLSGYHTLADFVYNIDIVAESYSQVMALSEQVLLVLMGIDAKDFSYEWSATSHAAGVGYVKQLKVTISK